MATVQMIFQGATPSRHADEIRRMLRLTDLQAFLISVAFVRESGVKALAAELHRVADKVTVYAGIRNEITSAQALHALLKLGIQLFVVDTGSREIIFHPKMYLATTTTAAEALTGSANLTHNGLHNNLEGSNLIRLSLADTDDRAFVKEATDRIAQLRKSFPDHIRSISKAAQIDALLAEGRIADEDLVIPRAAQPSQAGTAGGSDLPRMKLPYVAPPKIERPKKSLLAGNGKKTQTGGSTNASAKNPKSGFTLVWESRELARRDLNIPTSANTASTGSMGMKKGAMEGIDHRHYFRDEVFRELSWATDTKGAKNEIASFSPKLIISNIDHGQFHLTVRHDPRTNTPTYEQSNFMTRISWNDAREHVAREALLGRTLRLYKRTYPSVDYIIEID